MDTTPPYCGASMYWTPFLHIPSTGIISWLAMSVQTIFAILYQCSCHIPVSLTIVNEQFNAAMCVNVLKSNIETMANSLLTRFEDWHGLTLLLIRSALGRLTCMVRNWHSKPLPLLMWSQNVFVSWCATATKALSMSPSSLRVLCCPAICSLSAAFSVKVVNLLDTTSRVWCTIMPLCQCPLMVKNPQSHALCEKLHLTVGNVLWTLVHYKSPNDIHDVLLFMGSVLQTAVCSTHTVIHSALKHSPRSLAFQCDMLFNIALIADMDLIQQCWQAIADEKSLLTIQLPSFTCLCCGRLSFDLS